MLLQKVPLRINVIVISATAIKHMFLLWYDLRLLQMSVFQIEISLFLPIYIYLLFNTTVCIQNADVSIFNIDI